MLIYFSTAIMLDFCAMTLLLAWIVSAGSDLRMRRAYHLVWFVINMI